MTELMILNRRPGRSIIAGFVATSALDYPFVDDLVTLPMLALTGIPQAVLLDTLFVGEEWVSYGYEVRHQFESWRTQRRGTAGSMRSSSHSHGHVALSSEELLDEKALPV